MKKILVITLMLLSFAGSVFARGTGLANNGVTGEGVAVYAGNSQATADAAVNPIIKLSNKVRGTINFDQAGVATGTSASYAIGTKHTSGSKIFGTASDSTTIFFMLNASGTPLANATFGTGALNSNFAATGWTAY